eukprot:13122261-Ditylum_brightwellii.AAC.1
MASNISSHCTFHNYNNNNNNNNNSEWKGPIYTITDTLPEKDPKNYAVLNVKGHHPKFVSQGLYNSGVMILKQKDSALVLKSWRNLLVLPPWVGQDQRKLTQTVNHTEM